MKIEHQLSPEWRDHFRTAKQRMERAQQEILRLRGLIQLRQEEIEQLRQHISWLITAVAQADHAPECNYTLSDDCTRLIGEVENENKDSDSDAADDQ